MMKFEMTKKEMFAEFVAMATEQGRDDLVAMAKHEIELLDKKKSSPKKISDEDVARLQKIKEVLADGQKMTCSELIKSDSALDMSTPKMSALLKKLVMSGDVIREVEGKKAIFSLA